MKRNLALGLLALSVLLFGTAIVANAGVFVANPCFYNGSTGSFAPGWTASGSAVVVNTYPDPTCNPSSYEARIGHVGGDFYQVLTTVPGQKYSVSFDLAQLGYAGGNNTISWSATSGGYTFGTTFSNIPTDFSWTETTFTFTAESTSTVLDFKGMNTSGYWYVDFRGVQLVTPEPGTMALVGGALVLLGRRLRRKASA